MCFSVLSSPFFAHNVSFLWISPVPCFAYERGGLMVQPAAPFLRVASAVENSGLDDEFAVFCVELREVRACRFQSRPRFAGCHGLLERVGR